MLTAAEMSSGDVPGFVLVVGIFLVCLWVRN